MLLCQVWAVQGISQKMQKLEGKNGLWLTFICFVVKIKSNLSINHSLFEGVFFIPMSKYIQPSTYSLVLRLLQPSSFAIPQFQCHGTSLTASGRAREIK